MTQQTMEQREQSQACLRSATKETLGLSKNFAESRQRKAEGQYARGNPAIRNWLTR